MRRLNTQIPLYSEAGGLMRRRLRIVLLASLLTCCTLLLLPLSEHLVREEYSEEEPLRTRDVDTVMLSPPERSQEQERQEDDKSHEAIRNQEETPAAPEEAFDIEEPETDVADVEYTAPEFESELDMEAEFDVSDFDVDFSVKNQGEGEGQTADAQRGEGVSAGEGGQSFSAGELDREPTPRTRLEPRYPYAARIKGQEGYVVVRFVVTEEGEVVNAEVQDAEPPDIFNEAALRAVENWRFEPGKKNGEKVRSRMQQRIRFKLD